MGLERREKEVIVDSQYMPRVVIVLRNLLPGLVFRVMGSRERKKD